MKHKLLSALGLIVLGMVTLGVIPAEAASAAGPYYATPSWDQKLQCDTLATCPRFIVLSNWNNEAVLDRETGLVWEKNPSTGTRTWYDARDRCQTLSVGGRMGWRLPMLEEMMSLVDPNNPGGNPDLPPGHPFIDVKSSRYWSATSFANDLNDAWVADFIIGNVFNFGKTTAIYSWCVRGGRGVDSQ